jgi:two-component system response regulator PilR (NtrC family)
MQVKLLRAIQEKTIRPIGHAKEIPVNIRLLSATHKDLALEVAENRFRQDLFYRINVIQARIPALRERGDDIGLLANTFLHRLSDEWGIDEPKLSPAARNALKNYPFFGNVRELQNILERALTLCEGNEILPEHLQLPAHQSTNSSKNSTPLPINNQTNSDPEHSTSESLEDYLLGIEKNLIIKALDETRWNRTAAAKKLGMTFRSLRYRLKKLGLDDDSSEDDSDS